MRTYELATSWDAWESRCPHSEKLVIVMEHGPHYAKEMCKSCRTFLRWLKNPETIKLLERNKDTAHRLLGLPVSTVTKWEKDFLDSVRQPIFAGTRISPKQQAALDSMARKYLP